MNSLTSRTSREKKTYNPIFPSIYSIELIKLGIYVEVNIPTYYNIGIAAFLGHFKIYLKIGENENSYCHTRSAGLDTISVGICTDFRMRLKYEIQRPQLQLSNYYLTPLVYVY